MKRGCYEQAMVLLARRPHFRAEIEQKLQARGYGETDIELAVGRLVEQGYVDDRQSAEAFVRGKLARGPLGRRRLTAELERRGVSPQITAEVLRALMPGDETEAVREAASRWLEGGKEDLPALARHLERKGFGSRAILDLLDELGERSS